MGVAMVRVDARLVHGQVVETWLPFLRATAIAVIDPATAASPLAQAAMRMALPPEVDLEVLAPEQTDWTALAARPARTLVLTGTIAGAREIDRHLGLAAADVPLNVGVVQHETGRRSITAAVHLTEAEVGILSELAAGGVRVEVRSLPSQPALGVEDVRARFAKAG